MKFEDSFPRNVVEHADMGITMSDGVRLSARVWIPEDAKDNPVPVILEHLPYRKRDGTIVRDQFTHPWMAGHGYCCIRTDMRGTGESEGLHDDEYSPQELQDACDVIAWASSQPWCNGNIGMQGISWGGFNSLQVAALRPPALKAIISICSTVDRYADDIHYKGGCLLLENFGWSTNMLSYNSRPPDPALVGDDWQDIWVNRLKEQTLPWSTWHRHQHRDTYWKHGSVCEDFSAINAAVLSIGGWHDGYRNTISHLVENLSSPVKGIVGPWNHKYPHYAGPKPAIGFLQEAKRWWDHWLKGEDTGVEHDPAYRVYLMDSAAPKRWFDERSGRWIVEQEWPSANISQKIIHFGDGTLEDAPVTIEKPISSPNHCGITGGEYFPFAFGDELPDEQSPDDALSLCFDGPLTENTTDIVGAPHIQLNVSSDKPNAQITIRLLDLRPDGTSALITYGVLNLTHRDSHERPTALTPEKEYPVGLTLDQIAYRLPEGHRLRVAISTAYWPVIWPSPENVVVTIHSGTMTLPVRQKASQTQNEWEFEDPVGAPAWRTKSLRPSSYSRTTSVDDNTGQICIAIDEDSGQNRDLEHGLVSGSWFKERFYIQPDDPLSARTTSEWEQTGGRPGQMWRTHVRAEMTCDATHFHTTAHIKAYRENECIFENNFKDSVARDLV